MAEVSVGPASYAGRHPCTCIPIVRVYTRLPSIARHAHVFKHQLQPNRTKERSSKRSATVLEQPVSEQGSQDSTGENARSSPSIRLNAMNDIQASVAQENTIPASSDVPFGQSSTNVYTKAERASLANVPESQMTPEMLRRWRISKANKGKQPWNKGRRHSPETLARIKEGTRAAMTRPEVLARVRANHPSLKHTSQVKAKIGSSVSASRKRAKESAEVNSQASKEQSAHTAKPPKRVSRDSKLKRKTVTKTPLPKSETVDAETPEVPGRPNTDATAPGTAHKGQDTPVLDKRVLAEKHRQNISEAIRQKWADPEYRMRALSGMRSGGVSQANPRSSARARTIERSKEARAQLSAAKARHDKLLEARRTVQALQYALEAGQIQAEALRGDAEGFARQQLMLDEAGELIRRAQTKVAELEANTPSLEEVAAELGAKSTKGNDQLTAEEQALAVTEFVTEASSNQSVHDRPQLSLAGPANDSQARPAVSNQPHQNAGSQTGQRTTHLRPPTKFDSTPSQFTPTHSYRHGKLQQDMPSSRAESAVGNAKADLQPA